MASEPSGFAAPALRDIDGPLAFGNDRARFRRLLWFQSKLDFRLRYHGSVLGFAWALLHPLLFFGVLYLVFAVGLRFDQEIEHFAALLLFNLMLIHFFIEATTGALHSVVNREPIVRKTQFPRSIVPLSVVATSCIQLTFSIAVVAGFILITGVDPAWSWLLVAPALLVLLLFTVGVGLLLSILYARFRDVSQIWQVTCRGLIFLTPVFWVAAQMPERLREILLVNPLAVMFTQTRQWIIDPSAPAATEVVPAATLIAAGALLLLVPTVGLLLFVRQAPKVAETL